MTIFRRKKRKRRRAPSATAHFQSHKECARALITERLSYWNRISAFEYKRVSIKNQRTCWGSCSELGNLNFNYKIIFLPERLMDYIIVHELCHIAELSHSPHFWARVAKAIPDYRECRRHLRRMTHVPKNGFPSSVYVKYAYPRYE